MIYIYIPQGYGHCDILNEIEWEGKTVHAYCYSLIPKLCTTCGRDLGMRLGCFILDSSILNMTFLFLQPAVWTTSVRQTRPTIVIFIERCLFLESWPPSLGPISRETVTSSNTSQHQPTCLYH